jgi:nucleotide-binding universal stress UspA family protein
MEKILVPTDLSEKSVVALQYAIDFGIKDKAQVFLFNDAIHEEDQEKSESGLKQMLSEISSKHPAASELQIEPRSYKGPVLEGINKMLKEDKYQLIVMMTHGQDGINHDIGSITTKVVQKGKAPSLIVPENAEYKKIEKVLVVNDFSDPRNDEPAFKYLAGLLEKLEARAALLHAISSESKAVPADAVDSVIGSIKLENKEKTGFDTYRELISQVKEYSEKNGINMIFLPNAQVVYEKIFVGNMARLMALETSLPVLIQW